MILESLIGVVTGLVGNIVTSYSNLRMQKLKNEHEVAMIQAETAAMAAEAKANIQITETAVQGELERMDSNIYHETVKQATEKSLPNKLLELLMAKWYTMPFGVILSVLLGLVDFLKGLIRPGLTIYLVVLTSFLTFQAIRIIGLKQGLMSTGEALGLFKDVTSIVIYLTVSCVTWWFGDRRTAKFLYRLADGNKTEK